MRKTHFGLDKIRYRIQDGEFDLDDDGAVGYEFVHSAQENLMREKQHGKKDKKTANQ